MCATSLVRGEIEANAERHYAATQTRLGDRIEIDHKSRVDGASRNEIANLPIREFAVWNISLTAMVTSKIETLGLST
ncbi:hypothetical protein [Mesorhizobium sp.]|uniref:hypothetical protein n=1 Tax=Mesorhizobium sp. TaxID=1871066 RepID=UPI00258A0A0B|nr:hypothetical protein [Mesorhizobium sp.]